jgi:hypothetical protein
MIRVAPIAALMIAGLTAGAAAQSPAPGQTAQQSELPCFGDFQPLKAEAVKRGLLLRATIQKKVSREEACTLIKSYSVAEGKVVKFIQENARTCGIRAEAATKMEENHDRTLRMQHQLCQSGPGRIPMRIWRIAALWPDLGAIWAPGTTRAWLKSAKT